MPAGKSVIYKYSLLDDERRDIIDKMIAAAKHADLAVFRNDRSISPQVEN